MKKRITSILLTLVMLIGMIPFTTLPVFAEEVYPIVIDMRHYTDGKTYSDMTFDMSGKSVSHIFEIKGRGSVYFNNITFVNVSGTDCGSCVYIDGNDVGVRFTNCRFINCSAKNDGGAVYIRNLSNGEHVDFENCYVLNCSAGGNGGFMYINDADACVYGKGNTFISGCSAGEDGGAIYMYFGKKVDGFILSDNTASDGDGGGICDKDNDAVISNCRFYRNYAKVDGGGIYLDNGTVENCKFFDNDCSSDGYSLCAFWNETKINNCTFTSAYGENAVYNGTRSNCLFPAAADYKLSEGTGSKDDPYVINNIDDWDAMYCMVNSHSRTEYSDGRLLEFGTDAFKGKYVRLDADITVCSTIGKAEYDRTVGSLTYTSKHEFTGTFDGNGHTITYITGAANSEKAAFGYANSATVKNLTVNGYIKGNWTLGGIFGNAWYCTAENCVNNAEIHGIAPFAGGIVAYSGYTNVINCVNNGKVESSEQQVGGIVGYAEGGSISSCVNNGEVITGNQVAGGIVGEAKGNVSILNCINNGNVKANHNHAGGLIGYDTVDSVAVTVKNCISNGSVTAAAYADAITGTLSVTGLNYGELYYNKEKTSCYCGIGLSDNAMKGVSADNIDGKSYIMPDAVNDVVIENAPDTEGYMPLYLDENNSFRFAIAIDENSLTLGVDGKTTGYCVTNDETVLKDRVAVKGNVILILKNGSTLTAEKGITLESGNTLTVYGSEDSEKAGKLIAIGSDGNAAIGGVHGINAEWESGSSGTNCGELYLYGACVTVSNNDGVGFGGGRGGNVTYDGNGGNGGNGGKLYLYGGHFKAFGSPHAIGGGDKGKGGEYLGTDGVDGTHTEINGGNLFFAQTGNDESHAGTPFKVDLNTDQGLTNSKYVYLYRHTHNYDSDDISGHETHTGSVLSEGNIWIITAVAFAAVIGLAALFVVKKKKSLVPATGAKNKDDE